ncbi:G2/mitotic-specific cyclin 3 [Pseudovirgaria hyperparasitica]|uniref:G2/mitotic-specific cyclin 3 n=1 Tax=Pseudovirgaria hyperparasitica TaxID=470096 RepID=A0A6A6W896_9PEZI|nr:G2/mitotic-specific cyclin 3 [Pseudovirgaria hyperparasitica]KAF2759108.1 G2/mitotic-specific cyclin 3 [Pseudovirgaria hyperparasitica]
MDAKPQRPLRILKIRDENLPPQLPSGKTIHHRNKSTPALSTLMQAGALKPTAKRTAFADVSNTTKNPAIRDDIVVGGKKGSEVPKDPTDISIAELTKPPAILRPAQRPLQHAGIKAHGHTSTLPVVAPLKVAPRETITQDQPAASRRLVGKKSTAVFRETYSQEYTAISDPEPAKVVPVPSNGASLHQSLNARREAHLDALIQTAAEDAVKRPTRLEARSVPAVEAVLRAEKEFVEPRPYESADAYDTEPAPIPAEERNLYLASLEDQALVYEQQRDEEIAKNATAPASELIEYWDAEEEEEEEFYDAEGYTTARSLRSRGDNTTQGVTIVLVPVVTQKVERELAIARLQVESTRSIEDVEDEQYDTSMVAEYGEEIFDYMRDLEERMRPNPYYMDAQAEIQWSMRSVLMDWLVQVHHRFTLLPETLFLSVNYVDRFLSCKVVSLGKLQLVGATAIFVAAKYEEINCPSVQEIVYMVDGGYNVEEILKAERFMLSMLQFELGWPGPMSFLRRISKADDYDLETRTLAKYFLEVTIMDERFVGCPPSFTAAGAHCLARYMLGKGDWSLHHIHYSGYTLNQLRHLVNTILECCEDPRKHHQAVFDKYADKKYRSASIYVETELRRGWCMPQPIKSRNSIVDGLTHKIRNRQS